MSLVSQIASLASRIATEFNAIRTEMSSLGGGTPDPHAASHAAGGSDAVTLAQSQVTNLTTDLAGKADLSGASFTGEVNATLGGYAQFRAKNGTSPAFMIRNDGSNTYFLLTANGDPDGSWNSFRPFTISNSTGATTTISPTATGTRGLRNQTISTAGPSGGSNGDVWLKYTP